jgi:hypothetical protein
LRSVYSSEQRLVAAEVDSLDPQARQLPDHAVDHGGGGGEEEEVPALSLALIE